MRCIGNRSGSSTLLLLAIICQPCLMGSHAEAADDDNLARRILDETGVRGGLIVHLGCGDGKLTAALGVGNRYLVHGIDADTQQVAKARTYIRSLGAYGRVSVDTFDGRRLPYTDNLVNLLVAEDSGDVSKEEILRVLAPLGVAYLHHDGQWTKVVNPWPGDIDEWSHHLHAADGNPVANDRVVGPPKHFQWLAGPRWAQSHESDSNLRCLVTARGRIYYIVNDAPTSLAGPESPPDKWSLAARDAFNGVLLWKVPIQRWGWREWKPSWFTPRPGVIPINLDKRVVAAGDDLFATLGYRAPVSRFDGRTGEMLSTYAGTARTSEILHHQGRLVLTVLDGDRARVKLVDVESGRQIWASENDYGGTTTDYYRFSAMRGKVAPAKVDPTLDIATDGNVVTLLDGDSVVCLDYETGKELWRSTFPLVAQDSKAGGIDAHQKVWTGTMIVADGVVLHASPNQLAAFSARSGELLWNQPKKFLQHLWYEWKDVFVIDGLVWTWSAELAREKLEGSTGSSSWPVSLNGYDLHSGKLTREIPLGNIFKTHHHHRCYRNKATVRYVLASRRGSEFVDLDGGEHSIHNWVRGTCHMGMMPANGLQYAPPHPCECYIDEILNGFNALAAARESVVDEQTTERGPRLERGPAYTTVTRQETEPTNPADWPTFRADPGRSGSVDTRLPTELEPLWQAKLGNRVGPAIGVGDRVFVPLVDEHQIVALDAADGTVLWRFHAGARIDSPPTYDRGAVLFGSADGWVYRVSADSGQLEWRLRAGPEDRRIVAFGQLESAWPVHGAVLVAADTSTDTQRIVAYTVAGRSSHVDGGLHLAAIDAMTGRILKERNLAGPSYTADNLQQNYRLPMGTLSDILRLEDSSLFMRSTKFDMQLEPQRGTPLLKMRGGMLDDAYFKRMPWSMGHAGHARLIVYDDSHAYCLRMFDSLQGLDPKVYFTPGKQGYLLFAHDLGGRKNTWQQRIAIRGRAMVVTDETLCVAGPPDIVEKADPLAAFEGRKGGLLRIVDKTDGRVLSQRRLPMPPVFNGAMAANGRLILSLEDGTVVCFGAVQ
ncbi:MAG: PQQ-binding-like beta-propeller repeat protein [Thermoguttaceae bacterium]